MEAELNQARESLAQLSDTAESASHLQLELARTEAQLKREVDARARDNIQTARDRREREEVWSRSVETATEVRELCLISIMLR